MFVIGFCSLYMYLYLHGMNVFVCSRLSLRHMPTCAFARTQHDLAHRAVCMSGSCVACQFGSRLCRAKSVIGPPACARLVSLRMSSAATTRTCHIWTSMPSCDRQAEIECCFNQIVGVPLHRNLERRGHRGSTDAGISDDVGARHRRCVVA